MFSKFFAALGMLAVSSAAVAQAAAAAAPVVASTGFFAGLGGFIAGAMLSWPFLIAVLLFGVLAEHSSSRGFAVFFAIIAAIVAYFLFSIPLVTLAIAAGGYVVIGLVWSFWRYKRHADATIAEYKHSSAHDREYALRRLHPKAMLGTISAWVIIWPFSLIENLVGDVITAIHTMISKVFRGVYYRIYDSAVTKLGN